MSKEEALRLNGVNEDGLKLINEHLPTSIYWAMDFYAKEKSVEFAEFVITNKWSILNGNGWYSLNLEHQQFLTTEELYNSFITNKTKE